MRTISINIPESKFDFFVNLFKNLRVEFKETESITTQDWYEDLPNTDRNNIQQGLQDLNEGKTLTEEEVTQNIKRKIQQLKTA